MMKYRSYLRTLIIIISCCTASAYSKVIIWDLGDTLFGTSYVTFARQIGVHHFINYMLFDWQSPNIRPMVFDVLSKINPPEEFPREIATDSEGTPLPIIMNRWLAGIISGQELLKSVRDYIEHLDKQKYFISNRQKTLVLKTLEQMFDPESLVNATYPLPDAIALLNDCYHAKKPDGSPKNTLLVLSNWDTVSFDLLQKRYADIFDTYFKKNHIIVSGAIGLIKPEKEAFKYVLNTYKLDPADCIFINDLYENVLAAQAAGITALTICKGNYKSLRAILKKLDAL
ncbi:MAG TPA: HAD-IA family hydrolase [Candidatus Babeliales bacterium]|nr:HAD-IA family hydrolase [Candidatus Babeliales bacterium]